MRIISNLTAFILLSLMVIACGGGEGSGNVEQSSNTSPLAKAGNDQTVSQSVQVTLDGTASIDNDGNIVSYLWRQTQGELVELVNANSATATFTSPVAVCNQQLEFMLRVEDNNNATNDDRVMVEVTTPIANTQPTADAGTVQFVSSNQIVTLNASASNDQESNLSYEWSQIDNSGVNIILSDSNAIQPNFTAPQIIAANTVTFELTTTDACGLFDTQTVNIAIAPTINQKVNDTGFITCGDYNDNATTENSSNWESCNDLNDAGGDQIPEGQDADYGRDVSANDDADGKDGFSFIKLDAEGEPLTSSAAEWSCVLDNVTGLIWEVKTLDGGLQHSENTYSWYNSDSNSNGGRAGTQNSGECNGSDCDSQAYVNAVNSISLCGIDDWQMPSVEQLMSIVNYGQSTGGGNGPAIDTNFFPNTAPLTAYISSETPPTSIEWVKVVSPSDGDTGIVGKNGSHSIRLVSNKK